MDIVLVVLALLAVALVLALTVVAVVAIVRWRTRWPTPTQRRVDAAVAEIDADVKRMEDARNLRARLTRQHRSALSKRLAQRGMDPVIVDDCTTRRIRGGAA